MVVYWCVAGLTVAELRGEKLLVHDLGAASLARTCVVLDLPTALPLLHERTIIVMAIIRRCLTIVSILGGGRLEYIGLHQLRTRLIFDVLLVDGLLPLPLIVQYFAQAEAGGPLPQISTLLLGAAIGAIRGVGQLMLVLLLIVIELLRLIHVDLLLVRCERFGIL